VNCPVIAVPCGLVVPVKDYFVDPNAKTKVSCRPLIEPETDKAETDEGVTNPRQEFAKEIVPLTVVPDWDRLAVTLPLSPWEALHVPVQLPVRLRFGEGGSYTPIVTVFEETPPTLMVTGTAEPSLVPLGTKALTWYRPTAPGVNPEKATDAGTPPMVATGVVVVGESGSPNAGEPLAGWFVTGPRPVQKI